MDRVLVARRIYRRWPSERQRVVIQLIREELYSFVFRLNASEIPGYVIKWKFLKYFKHVHTKNDIRADKFWTIRILQYSSSEIWKNVRDGYRTKIFDYFRTRTTDS